MHLESARTRPRACTLMKTIITATTTTTATKNAVSDDGDDRNGAIKTDSTCVDIRSIEMPACRTMQLAPRLRCNKHRPFAPSCRTPLKWVAQLWIRIQRTVRNYACVETDARTSVCSASRIAPTSRRSFTRFSNFRTPLIRFVVSLRASKYIPYHVTFVSKR